MIVAMQERATEEDIQGVIERLVQVGSMFIAPRAPSRRFWRV